MVVCENLLSSLDYSQDTSLPYFGVKLSCVCLMFAYRTSLKSLRLRKLLDQSTFAYWVLLDLTGPYLALLGLSGPHLALTGPHWALLGLTGPYWALLGLTGSFIAFAD